MAESEIDAERKRFFRPGESLEQLQARLFSEKFLIPLEEINKNFDRGCACLWTPEFRAKVEAIIRARPRSELDTEEWHLHQIELSLDMILGPH